MKTKDLFNDKVVTLSNFLSFFRILIVPFILLFFYLENKTGDSKYTTYIMICYFLIAFSDFFDGFLARLLNQISRLGRFLDPMADKIAALSITSALSYYKNFPLWLLGVIYLREIVVVSSAFFLFTKKDVEVKPNIFGKLGIASISLVIIYYTIFPAWADKKETLRLTLISLVLIFFALNAFLAFKNYYRFYLGKKV